jgi:hypothetical protein
MGLYQIYPTRPTQAPEANLTLERVTDAPTLACDDGAACRVHSGLSTPEITANQLFDAFTNHTSGVLMSWHYSGTNSNSGANVNRLAELLSSDPLCSLAHLSGFNFMHEMKLLDKYIEDKSNPFRIEYGWCQSTIKIRLPMEKKRFLSEADAPELSIPGMFHRLLTNIITHVFENDISQTFNMMPFEQFWTTPDHQTVKVFGEAYASPVLMEAYKEINALPHDPRDDFEHVVTSIMVWSDATHLASFGDASLWPFYVYFGNQSKYTRGRPTARASHHLAYIPTVCLAKFKI